MVRLQINSFGIHPSEERINETDELLFQAITDLRNLSHSLNNERFNEIGFIQAIHEILLYFEKIKLFKIGFYCSNDDTADLGETALIVYRIVQEILNNVVKHANATNVEVIIDMKATKTKIEIQDNGIGFNAETINVEHAGIGFKNIFSRAKLINAKIEISSSHNKGTKVSITV